MKLRMECWEYKKKGWFADVEVIEGIFYKRNHQGIQNVISVQWCDRFNNENVDGITEGFKIAAPYGDVPYLPPDKSTES
jgi:hypothetical protein